MKIVGTKKIFTNPVGVNHRAVESLGLRVDPIDAIQKRGVQHHRVKDNIRFVEGIVEYVRETVGYEQGIFDAKII